MRVLYVGLNAKYLHTNPAIRILKKLSDSYAHAAFKEFTLKDDMKTILDALMEESWDMIGFSCYIWNIEKIKQIVTLIRSLRPGCILFAGGPEVSYSDEVAPFDYIIKGDAEESLVDFLLYRKTPSQPRFASSISKVPFIGDLYQEDDFAHRIIYMEASRGCPFRCSYCLSSVQSPQVIFKEEEATKNELMYYLQHGAKTIKFLDRSFNVNPDRFLRFLTFLQSVESNQTFQFEIAADLLTEKVMQFLCNEVKKNQIRLEIGVQSTLEKANQAVERSSNIIDVLEKIWRFVDSERVIVHVDLIVGLPYEDYLRTQQSLNEVMNAFPHELQLGFLKCLKGTKLAVDANRFGYIFSDKPPYEIIQNDVLSPNDLSRLKEAEIGLESLWNRKRLTTTIRYLMEHHQLNPYRFFEQMGRVIRHNHIKKEVDYYRLIWDWAESYGPEIRDLIKQDYLKKNRIRPLRFWGRESQSFITMKEQILLWTNWSKIVLRNAFISEISDGYLVLLYQPEPRLYSVKKDLLLEIT